MGEYRGNAGIKRKGKITERRLEYSLQRGGENTKRRKEYREKV
jgi:hypothetical protein